ncbi:unnamed protein product [Dovyalis caffra]|uniref:Uncharacterized protein n=1 Tax=Dovyalis caffra TaxID=77055 RepID=A0AAV1QUG3_9ROSI|nr:unnamed protein product [Dovyalis caffra]
MNNCFDDDSFEPSSLTSTSTISGDPKVEEAVHQLLEEGWFFGKLVANSNSQPKMLRCYSDPSPNFDQQILAKTCPSSQISSSTRKSVTPGNLTRAPSLPPNIGRSEEKIHEIESSTAGMSRKLTRQLSDQILIQKPSCVKKKEGKSEEKASLTRRSKMMEAGKSSQHSLLRTPSLPPYIGREEMIELENESDEITMSKLIRQAMPLSSDILPRQPSSKMITPKHRPPRNLEVESSDALRNSTYETRHISYPKNQRKLDKSLSNVEFHEVQGFKDLGFKFDKKDLNPPSMVEIFAGLQEKKKHIKQDQDHKVREPYPSGSWQVTSCDPVWAAKNSAQEMKAQLKFWARSVASNVR